MSSPADTLSSRTEDAARFGTLDRALRQTLGDVHVAVRDWPKLREAMRNDAAGLADREAAALLEWLESGMLTQLGHLVRHRDGSHTGALGICRRSARDLLADTSYERAFAWFEDPVLKADPRLMAKLRRETTIPIAAGSSGRMAESE